MRFPNQIGARAIGPLAAAWILFCAAAPAAAQCVHYEEYIHPIGVMEAGDQQVAIATSGAYAYVTALTLYPEYLVQLLVIDITDRARPRQVGSADLPMLWGMFQVAAAGSLILLTSHDDGCLITIDAADPHAPRAVGLLPVDGARSVAASGTYAYVTGNDFNVVDISDPRHPRIVASLSGSCFGIAIAPPYAYVGAGSQGFEVIDISDPVHPTLVAGLPTSGQVDFVSLDGDRAYVTEYNLSHFPLRVVDVSDPLHPRFRGSLPEIGETTGLAVSGRTLCAANPYCGLSLIDVSDPDHPAIGDCLQMSYWTPYAVAVGPGPSGPGVIVYAAGSVTLDYIRYFGVLYPFEVNGSRRVPLQGRLDLPASCHGLAASGPHAYLASGSRGLDVVDASDPVHPTIVGTADTPGDASAVAVAGRFAYVADDSSGLQVVDVGNPAMPAVVGSVDTPGTAQDVAVVGGHAYVADGASGLEVIDISDPTHPSLVGGTDTTGDIQHVAASGDYAYVTGPSGGMHVVLVSDPKNPRVVGFADLGPSSDVEVSGRYCYVAASPGLCVVDVQDPTRPQVMGSLWRPYWGGVASVAVTPQEVYLATGEAAAEAVDARDPRRPRTKGWISTYAYASGIAVSGSRVYIKEESGCARTQRLFVAPADCEPTVRPPIDSPIRLMPGPLATARPNPTRGATTVQLSMPASAWVRAEIWDVTGRLVRTLHDGLLPAGPRDIAWNGRDQEGRSVPAGIYWIRIEGAGANTTRRLVVLR